MFVAEQENMRTPHVLLSRVILLKYTTATERLSCVQKHWEFCCYNKVTAE